MKIIIFILSIILFSGCTLSPYNKYSKAVQSALSNPTIAVEFARVRIFPTINQRGYSDYLGIHIIENGKLKFVGFSRYDNQNISLGMPQSKTYRSVVERNQLFGEYSVPANSPIIVGYSDSKHCSGWFFQECWVHTFEQYFIPEPNKDYDIINEHHVYELDKSGNQKQVDSTGEIIRSRKNLPWSL